MHCCADPRCATSQACDPRFYPHSSRFPSRWRCGRTPILACVARRPLWTSSPRVLWSWERREDLRPIDTRRYAIAYLDQTITIDLNAHSEARRNPVLLPDNAVRIPVVRIETASHAVLNAANREAIVQALLVSAQRPGIAALQIDFDATASQRTFYRGILEDLRKRMPAGLPLSIGRRPCRGW
jgi:hypothetical protein